MGRTRRRTGRRHVPPILSISGGSSAVDPMGGPFTQSEFGDRCPAPSTARLRRIGITFEYSIRTRRPAQARLLPPAGQDSMNTDVYSPREIALAAGVPEEQVVAALGGS